MQTAVIYYWILPSTSGQVRESLESVAVLSNPQLLGVNAYVNLFVFTYQLIGRFVVQTLFFGFRRSFEGLRAKTFQVTQNCTREGGREGGTGGGSFALWNAKRKSTQQYL